MHRVAILSCLAVLVAAARVGATDVYRCAGAHGVSFQDRPCAGTQKQSIVHLADAPAAPAPNPDAVPETAPMPDTAAPPEPAPAAAPAARAPAPDFFLCTRYDGSRYPSDTGVGSRSAVPYGMLGGSGQSLAEAYGGRNGIGVSAPGLRHVPTLPAEQSPLAGAYVWVDDECHHADPPEACAYLRGRLDDVTDRLKRAFSDTEAQLKQEQASLRERLRGC
jgi:hypothetical protein